MSDSAARRSPRSRAIRSLRTAQVRLVTLACDTQPVALELGRPRLVAQAEMREAAGGGGRADSARTESRGSRRSRPTRDPSGRRAPASLRARPPARARGRRNGRGGAARGAARGCREARPGAAPRRSGRRRQPRASPPRRPRTGDPDRRSREAVRAVDRSRPPPPGSAAGRRQLCVRAPSANERSSRLSSDSASAGGLLENVLRSTEQLDVGPREKRPCSRLAPVRRELQRLRRPLLDELHVEADRPHRRPDRGLECEERVRVRSLLVVERAFESAQQAPSAFLRRRNATPAPRRLPARGELVHGRPSTARSRGRRARPPRRARGARARACRRATASARHTRGRGRARRASSAHTRSASSSFAASA